MSALTDATDIENFHGRSGANGAGVMTPEVAADALRPHVLEAEFSTAPAFLDPANDRIAANELDDDTVVTAEAEGISWVIDQGAVLPAITVNGVNYSVPSGVMRTPQHYGCIEGEADSTVKFQRFLDAIQDGETVRPSGSFNITNVVFQGKDGVDFDGSALNLTVNGQAASDEKNGFELAGILTDCDVHGIRAVCSRTVADRHAGIWSNSGGTFTRLRVFQNDIDGGINNISLNTNLSGAMYDCEIFNNKCRYASGTASGEGYGIHYADGSGSLQGVKVYDNFVEFAERHSIYHAKGLNGIVARNKIFRHRYNIKTGQVRGAIQILRSSNTHATANELIDCSDGDIVIAKAGVNGVSNTATGNIITKTADSNTVPAVNIGSQGPATLDPDINDGVTVEGAVVSTVVSGNIFAFDGCLAQMVRVWSGIDVSVSVNEFNRKNVLGANVVCDMYGRGGDQYNNDWKFSDNVSNGNVSTTMFLHQAASGGESNMEGFEPTIEYRNNINKGDGGMFGGAALSGTGVYVFQDDLFQLDLSLLEVQGKFRFKHTSDLDVPVLAAGETFTTNISVGNAKVGDSVTVSLSSIGSSNIEVSAQVNQNNNVRLLLTNVSGTNVDPAAGVVTLVIFADRDTLPIYGPQVMENSSFDDGLNGWTDASSGTSSWSASGGTATQNIVGGNTARLRRSFVCEIGQQYIVEIAGTLDGFGIGTTSGGSETLAFGAGQSRSFVATANTHWFNTANGIDGITLESVSVKRIRESQS